MQTRPSRTHTTHLYTAPKILLVNRIIIQNRLNQFLIIQRSADDSYRPLEWEFPGGKLETLQDISQSIHREVTEETGLNVKIISQIAFVESKVITDGRYNGYTYVGIFGTARATKSKVSISKEHNDYRWVDIGSIGHFKLTPESKHAFDGLFR